MTRWNDELLHKLEARTARVGVVGLGYVGLPLVLQALEAGFEVTGIDVDRARLDAIAEARSYLVDVSDEQLAGANSTDRFTTTSSFEAIVEVDVVLIAVPTPLSGEAPDLSFVLAAAEGLAPHLTAGSLVSLESTTYPGTTEERLRPCLESGGLIAGEDFALVFSPERIDPGNQHFGLREIPKVLGGLTKNCSVVGEAFYSTIVDKVVVVRGPREAEMTKLLENTYRQVNIALANEFAMVAHELDIDIWEVIDAAATKPFGFQPFYPGVGIGGHCIAVDPVYLTWRIRELGRAPFRLVELAREIDSSMPTYVANRVAETLAARGIEVKGSKLLVLGITYKPDVADIRESRALEVFEKLLAAGAEVTFHDPLTTSVEVGGAVHRSVGLDDAVAGADAVVILTHHSAYDWDQIAARAKILFDARGVTNRIEGESIDRL